MFDPGSSYSEISRSIDRLGHVVVSDFYSEEEVAAMIDAIDRVDGKGAAFRKSNDLFAIRNFLGNVPEIIPLVFNDPLKKLISEVFGPHYFVVKSIYFDKPPGSNWFVAWHQDLMVHVTDKANIPGYGPWTVKPDLISVQPPDKVLEKIFTLRIHLDDTDENNGALKIAEGSHKYGVIRTDGFVPENIRTCTVKAGGLMIMKPLLFHTSSRTVDNRRRRVIHIELSEDRLEGTEWAEGWKC